MILNIKILKKVLGITNKIGSWVFASMIILIEIMKYSTYPKMVVK
jgi:hypothetical protein